MPLARISLLKGRSPETLRAIAEDRFQIIEQRDPGEIIYSSTYLGIERTDDLIIIHLVAGHWRDDAAKRALYRSIADRLTANPGLRAEDIQVVITSNDKPDWSFGNGVASYLPA
jgi:phenylpyruvate tautomerase PptA (4-oxalocrotonate tautomerase family)